MVVGEETPDEGAVSVPKKLTIGRVPQGRVRSLDDNQGIPVLVRERALRENIP